MRSRRILGKQCGELVELGLGDAAVASARPPAITGPLRAEEYLQDCKVNLTVASVLILKF